MHVSELWRRDFRECGVSDDLGGRLLFLQLHGQIWTFSPFQGAGAVGCEFFDCAGLWVWFDAVDWRF
jgi:hypothetical protein